MALFVEAAQLVVLVQCFSLHPGARHGTYASGNGHFLFYHDKDQVSHMIQLFDQGNGG